MVKNSSRRTEVKIVRRADWRGADEFAGRRTAAGRVGQQFYPSLRRRTARDFDRRGTHGADAVPRTPHAILEVERV